MDNINMSNKDRKKIIIGIVVLLVLLLGGWLLVGQDRSSVVEAPTAEFSGGIVGAWRSVEYSSLVREFREGGVLVDKFGTAEVAEGSWQTFDRGSAPVVPGVSFHDEAVYLAINLTGEERDTIYFEVRSVDEEELELLYIGPGGTMNFTRVE